MCIGNGVVNKRVREFRPARSSFFLVKKMYFFLLKEQNKFGRFRSFLYTYFISPTWRVIYLGYIAAAMIVMYIYIHIQCTDTQRV